VRTAQIFGGPGFYIGLHEKVTQSRGPFLSGILVNVAASPNKAIAEREAQLHFPFHPRMQRGQSGRRASMSVCPPMPKSGYGAAPFKVLMSVDTNVCLSQVHECDDVNLSV